jgi:hypothetical protein
MAETMYVPDPRATPIVVTPSRGYGGGGGGTNCGTGSPEGVVSASCGETYYDTSSGSFWVKETGTNTTTGWVTLIV